MSDRIMSLDQIRYYREKAMKEETAAFLNMLYRTARASTEAAEDNIIARTDLTEEQKEKKIAIEWALFRLSKREKRILSHPMPENRAYLVAFNNALDEAVQKYLLYERNGVYRIL